MLRGDARAARGVVSDPGGTYGSGGALGERGEEAAARHLESLGFRILDRRFRTRGGEIDLVAEDAGTLVFVEVKTRSSDRFGSPAEAVDARKRSRLLRAARIYMTRRGGADRACRFDVMEVVPGPGDAFRCLLIRDAFEAGS
jgi:putative endonuclease